MSPARRARAARSMTRCPLPACSDHIWTRGLHLGIRIAKLQHGAVPRLPLQQKLVSTKVAAIADIFRLSLVRAPRTAGRWQ
ncbi:MAG: hypothetical protein JWM76_4420 [Pseudonocardiales bacterium]|nr:hypothetical protein [Pseudonocardiales bacterium]